MTLPPNLAIPDFDEWGLRAFTTTRAAGTFGTQSAEPAVDLFARWNGLVRGAAELGAHRFASASQVHGAAVAVHDGRWTGWLRLADVDGHAWLRRGTAAAVTVADCVPVFIAHPSGAGALLHSGWRGTVQGITERAIEWFTRSGFGSGSLRIHLGPSICGSCYEVSPDVYGAVTGSAVSAATPVDLRASIAGRARRLGVRDIATSEWCTRCSSDQLFSHRAGDAGRQLGVLIAPDADA
ncbi:MAG TPA: polyphenol oxidase family protein [Gemmatimonadaceae bacterium]|nr:polyphenol oxidase family protein [Gemmatimonadaceae bacterium]